MKYEPQSEADNLCGLRIVVILDVSSIWRTIRTNMMMCPQVIQSLASELLNELSEMNRTLFEPDRGDMILEACDVAISQNRFVGPFLNVPNDWYTPPPKPSEQKLEDDSLREELKLIDKEKVRVYAK